NKTNNKTRITTSNTDDKEKGERDCLLQKSRWTSCRDVIFLELFTLSLLVLFVICLVIGHYQGSKFWWKFMLWEEFAVVPIHCLWIYYLCNLSETNNNSKDRSKNIINMTKFSPTLTFF